MSWKGKGEFTPAHIENWLTGLLDLGGYLRSGGVKIMCGDFEDVLRLVNCRTDVIYADPPYYPITGKEQGSLNRFDS